MCFTAGYTLLSRALPGKCRDKDLSQPPCALSCMYILPILLMPRLSSNNITTPTMLRPTGESRVVQSCRQIKWLRPGKCPVAPAVLEEQICIPVSYRTTGGAYIKHAIFIKNGNLASASEYPISTQIPDKNRHG